MEKKSDLGNDRGVKNISFIRSAFVVARDNKDNYLPPGATLPVFTGSGKE
ncbi:MAG: hypothetical protein Q7J27_07460 [Syntrophales bacterium]|nr:hypothetical protein [Syntrophales bacterium]